MEEFELLEKRERKIAEFLKEKKDWVIYGVLTALVFLSIYIRTRNIPLLKDITTGDWTLGPDLDPFLFLRWAEYIVEHGKLMALDTMRYAPLGYNTASEMKLLSYLIAWFHHLVSFFVKDASVTYSAILFPVAMAALTAVAFFLFARKIFYKEKKLIRNLIALIATGFFILIPSLLPRTIAGIPEKESAAFFFIFIAFYFFLESFTAEKLKRGILFGVLAGVSTGLLALIWGGVTFVLMAIAGAVFLAFLLGKTDKKKMYIFGVWIFSFSIVMIPFATIYTPMTLVTSTSTGAAFFTFFIMLSHFLLFEKKIFNLGEKAKKKIKLPDEILSAVIAVIILIILAMAFLGPSFITYKIKSVVSQTVQPLSQSRFGITVAENRQPYFSGEWKSEFGPIKFNLPLYFWLFFIGSIFLFGELVQKLRKKEKAILVFGYFIFLVCLIFSRYSSTSSLDGESNLSLLVYLTGFLFFIGVFGKIYYNKFKEKSSAIFKEFNLAYLLYFVVFTMSLIGARGAIRLIMVLGAVSPVVVAFLAVKLPEKYFKEKDETKKIIFGAIAIIVLVASIFTLWSYYKQDKTLAENFGPSSYTQQWQKAMFWVRENTPENSVFAHWWDYGYWVQSIGKRATILDGANSQGYWNHLMGRYVLTGTSEKDAAEFMYAHNGTHLLIDSTEIGKYTAYSSIGSDADYDRFSWISTFIIDETQTQETKEEVIYLYRGGTTCDEDIVWNQEGKEIFLPKRKSGVGGIFITKNGEEIIGANAIFIYNNNQYVIPLKYVSVGGVLHEFEKGLDAGVFIFPYLRVVSGQAQVSNEGAMLYLSGRTIHSNLANLYLFGQDSDYFKLAHTESSAVVEALKQQGNDFGEFVYYQGTLQGPIKIWRATYHSKIEFKDEYLQTFYPEELSGIKEGEYN